MVSAQISALESIVKSLEVAKKRQEAVLAETVKKLDGAEAALEAARVSDKQRDLVAQAGRKP